MNKSILNIDIQDFINQKLDEDLSKLILKGSPFPKIKIQEIADQIISKRKCEKKLPTWFQTNNIYYPNKLNIEQSSSEITANYKSELVFGNSIIDITGGFGIDCYYFSRKIKDITHCEMAGELSQIVQYNFNIMQVENVKTITDNSLDYLRTNHRKYDWIYADPSRRNDTKGRVFLLEDCSPDIPKYLNFLFERSDNILLKISPLLDISATIKALKNTREVHAVAVKNEVKEVLFILQKNYTAEISFRTINFKNNLSERFDSSSYHQASASYQLPDTYLYEPNAAILKLGLFNEISARLNIDKLHVNSHLYTSKELIEFPGRRFKIIQSTTFDKKKLLKLIPSGKANITTRNFPQSVAQIRKKTGIKEGGNQYLFFTTNLHNKPIVLICEKV